MSSSSHTEGLDRRSQDEILCAEAVDFVAQLHHEFGARRTELLAARGDRQQRLLTGESLDFLPETRAIREGHWGVAPPRSDYVDRRAEITGPTDRKLIINALNSGARGFMADFEDANSPTWHNQISGQLNLVDAVDGTITYESWDGRVYALGEPTATLLMRPRGLHMTEKHLCFDRTPVAGAFLDFGLFAFHSATRLAELGRGAYLYLPKLEHYLEARLWDDVFTSTERTLGLDHGTFRATVLIETLPAAFQMDEILYELADHSYGLNAGRWDYIFSMIKSFRERPEFVLPDRADVTMTVPFMSAYAQLLVETCHRRGAFAMGGMAALIPSRTDQGANDRAIAAVKSDKEREASLGFDGTWIAHPDVVQVAMAAFNDRLGNRPNQIESRLPDVDVTSKDLLDAQSTPGSITEAGLRSNINICFQYLSFWLGGRGAAGINHLMEDAATAEICRSQIWQWIRHAARLDDGSVITRQLVEALLQEEMDEIRNAVDSQTWQRGRPTDSRQLFERIALSEDFVPFLTGPAYELLD
jgi:malate synthase